jgi:ribosome-associated translation inhibitor RaiA
MEDAMRIQINTHDTAGDDEFTGRVETAIASGLDRFADQITRVEVHLADVNAGKGGPADKRCMIEARPTHHAPVAVTHQAETIPLAIDGAIEKARKALDKALAARTDHKGRPSVRDNDLR